MYEFLGVFTAQCCSSLRLDSREYTLRDLRPSYPFWGVRAHPRRDDVGGNTRTLEEAASEMISAGLTCGFALHYQTFGGPIEHLAGFEIAESAIVAASRFDTASNVMDDDLLPLFISKMSEYGLPPEETGFFFPFQGGFWGEFRV